MMEDSNIPNGILQGDPIVIKAYAEQMASQTVARYREQVKNATVEQIISMLNQIIIDAPAPEEWTEQHQKDLSTIAFVLSWLAEKQSKEAHNG